MGQMQQVQCMCLAWRKHQCNISRVELDAQLVKCFAWAKIVFNGFSYKFIEEFESLYKLYKTNNEFFLIRAME